MELRHGLLEHKIRLNISERIRFYCTENTVFYLKSFLVGKRSAACCKNDTIYVNIPCEKTCLFFNVNGCELQCVSKS